MKRIFKGLGVALGVGVIAVSAYGYGGWRDAAKDAEALQARAADLRDRGFGADSLTPAQQALFLLVEDPAFVTHTGTDISTKGAGLTTITQSLAKRLAFDAFRPGIGKIRQTTYAMSLERRLSKDEILTLALETAHMGPSEGGWVIGFHKASEVYFGKDTSDLSEREFITLVATLIAPSRLAIPKNGEALQTRIARIERLAAGECEPKNNSDVWLEGCA